MVEIVPRSLPPWAHIIMENGDRPAESPDSFPSSPCGSSLMAERVGRGWRFPGKPARVYCQRCQVGQGWQRQRGGGRGASPLNYLVHLFIYWELGRVGGRAFLCTVYSFNKHLFHCAPALTTGSCFMCSLLNPPPLPSPNHSNRLFFL